MELSTSNLIAVEEKYNLLLDDIDGFCYWAYLRFDMRNILTKADEIKKHSRNVELGEAIRILINLTVKNPMLHASHKDIFFVSHQRRVLIDGRYECIYTDQIARQYPNSSACGEFLNGTKHLTPSYTSKLLKLDCIDITPALFFKLHKLFVRNISDVYHMKAKKICDIFLNEFNVKIEEYALASQIEKMHYCYIGKRKRIMKILKRVSPKLVVEVVSYEFNRMVLNEACKELCIPTVELQHGVIGRGHIAYNYLSQVKYDFLPDKLLVFADYWKETCSFPIGKGNIVTVGYPYLDKQHLIYPKKHGNMLKILALSQPSNNSTFPDLIMDLYYKLRESGEPFEIIYKLHPAEYDCRNGNWRKLCGIDNIRIINSSVTPLYALFSEVDMQIGMSSTAIFEGLSYNLITGILYTSENEMYMSDLCKMGLAKMCYTVDDFVSLINNKKRLLQGIDGSNEFFSANALEKMKVELTRALDASDDCQHAKV